MYPVTHLDASKHLNDFINNRLVNFGKYQDAVNSNIVFGYHSVISSSLNIGLLTPKMVVDAVLSSKKKIPINSIEGFIRQIIGWREYCHLLYHYESETMRKSNYFNATRKLGPEWWTGTTGLTPIDDIISRALRYSYAHHIERLMYLAAMMMMCGISPHEMYNWFITIVSIDAYDWVMVPNIYGMGSFADGGMMMTKPYFSSGKYIKKMSNYNDNNDNLNLWTDIYYNFIANNIPKLKNNYYTSKYIKNYERKSDEEKKRIKASAEGFINKISS